MALELKSDAFDHDDFIPKKFTCQGEDVSPQLSWKGAPEKTQSLALICDDPDAPMGTWVHWVIYDMPVDISELKEGIPALKILDNGARQGVNDFGNIGYGGPCPPPGKPHRYFFKLYCLDIKLEFSPGLSKEELLDSIEGHILDSAELVGKYKR
jgi:Raf kinase inhibitor-like YbhB/YbcL family protein